MATIVNVESQVNINFNYSAFYEKNNRLIINNNNISSHIHKEQSCCHTVTLIFCCVCRFRPLFSCCNSCCNQEAESEQLAVTKFSEYLDKKYGHKINNLAQKSFPEILLPGKKYLETFNACRLIKRAQQISSSGPSQSPILTLSTVSSAISSSRSPLAITPDVNSIPMPSTAHIPDSPLPVSSAPSTYLTSTIPGNGSISPTLPLSSVPISESLHPNSNSPSIQPASVFLPGAVTQDMEGIMNATQETLNPVIHTSSQSTSSFPSSWPPPNFSRSLSNTNRNPNKYLVPLSRQKTLQVPRSPASLVTPRIPSPNDLSISSSSTSAITTNHQASSGSRVKLAPLPPVIS